jgi:hypothetical protein
MALVTLNLTYLVHLVGDEYQVVLLAEPYDFCLIVCVEALPCGVAWVDHHQAAHTQPLLLRGSQLRLQEPARQAEQADTRVTAVQSYTTILRILQDKQQQLLLIDNSKHHAMFCSELHRYTPDTAG